MTNSVDPVETAHMSCLIWIYAVCKSLLLSIIACGSERVKEKIRSFISIIVIIIIIIFICYYYYYYYYHYLLIIIIIIIIILLLLLLLFIINLLLLLLSLLRALIFFILSEFVLFIRVYSYIYSDNI